MAERIKNRFKRTSTASQGRRSSAFVIEALIVLIILIACLAIFTRLFAYSYKTNSENAHRAQAIVLATNQAEAFAADPAHAQGTFHSEDGYITTCAVKEDATSNGVLYKASISVCYENSSLYTLSTSHYVSNSEKGAE